MKLYAFTGALNDVRVENVAQAVKTLGTAMRSVVKQIRAYQGSYWQTEITPSEMGDFKRVHVHSHASLLIPAKSQPDAEDMAALWSHVVGVEAASVHWTVADHPQGWLQYSTKAEDLSGFTQPKFDSICNALKATKLRGWVV